MPMTDPSSGNGRQKAGKILIYICAVGLIFSAALKFAHVPKVVAQMSSMGYEDGKLVLVAGLELISALLFLVPATRSVGLLIISAFLGGAIASHVAASQFLQVLPPSVFLFLTWFGSWLRHPEVLWSWSGQTGRLPARREIAGSL
jgi:DoxX-like protein